MWLLSLSVSHRRFVGGTTRLASTLRFASGAKQPFSSSSSTSPPFSLKRLIQPFVKKCHPDMARQQGLPETARSVNLEAIQNLNSYIDGVHKLIKDEKIKYPFPSEDHTINIEFVIPMEKNQAETATQTQNQTPPSQATGNKKNNKYVVSMSRRKLELLVPPMDMSSARVKNHVMRQFLNLLRISDLPVPASLALYDGENDEEEDDYYGSTAGASNGNKNYDQDPKQRRHGQRPRRPVSAWEASRERFWRRHKRAFDSKKFNRIYREALHDAQVHIRTRNWIRDNPRLRHKLLANGAYPLCARMDAGFVWFCWFAVRSFCAWF